MFKALAWLFLFLALGVAAYDLNETSKEGDKARLQALGESWAQIDKGSLIGFNSIVENKVSPELWSDYVQPALLQPGLYVFGAFALIFFALHLIFSSIFGGRKRRR